MRCPHALAVFGFAVLATLLVFPALSGEALGHPQADTYNHVWGFWQVRDALLSGESPLWTDNIGWPQGGALWFIDLFGALWTLPIQLLAGPVVAYDLAMWANLVLAGFAAWLLARRLGSSEAGSAFAGVTYAAVPQLLGQLHNGISETLSVGWLPLGLWGLVRFWREPGRNNGLIAGGLVAVCGFANFYYGLFLGLIWAAAGVWTLLPRARGRLVLRQLGWVVLGGLPLLPLLWVFSGTLSSPEALVSRDPEFVYASLVGHNMVDLLAFFHPGDFHSPDLFELFDEHLQVVVYVGWILLVPALFGAWRVRRARWWAVLALVSFVFALGPFLYLGGGYWQLPGGTWVPLPFLAFFEVIPLFSPISHAYRFAIPMQLALGVCAALWIRGRWGWLLIPAFLVEVLLFSPATWPVATSEVAVPAVYSQISTDGAVLDLPVSLQVLDRSRYNLYQVSHRRPIPYGLNDPTPQWLDDNPLTRSLIDLERSGVASLPPTRPTLDLILGRQRLVDAGFSAIVVHLRAYPPHTRDKVLAELELICGPGRVVGDQVLFSLGQ
ncbi:MAG TPA: hypothetical protein QGF58_19190 [Myxococcota bacterium]|nr:hypothetical protein [Myxococcota bacterium]